MTVALPPPVPVTAALPPGAPGPWTAPQPLAPHRMSRRGRRLLAIGIVATVLALAGAVWAVASAFDVGLLARQTEYYAEYPKLSPDEVAATEARVREVAEDLDAWWSREMAARDLRYLAIEGRITDGDDGLTCDKVPVAVDDALFDNAWVSTCVEGAVVAYDPATFRRSDLTLRLILAHEWGHVVQLIGGPTDEMLHNGRFLSIDTELQADCYAGAWGREHLDATEIATAREELRLIGDPPFTSATAPDAHGSGDDRADAFDMGLDGGVDACLPDTFVRP